MQFPIALVHISKHARPLLGGETARSYWLRIITVFSFIVLIG